MIDDINALLKIANTVLFFNFNVLTFAFQAKPLSFEVC